MRTVHFILTSGELGPCERRAILSAAVHNAPIILWHVGDRPDVTADVETRKIDVPEWAVSEHKSHVFDVLAYEVAYEHGGLILGLDTISVRSAWDLINSEDVVLSTDWPSNDPDVPVDPQTFPYRYNNNFLAKQGSFGADILRKEARRQIADGNKEWACTGPLMLPALVQKYPLQIAAAPYPALCGWAPGYLWRFYLGHETPGPNVRVIHLCRIMYHDLYERRYADWAKRFPNYSWSVASRTDANERLLRCP